MRNTQLPKMDLLQSSIPLLFCFLLFIYTIVNNLKFSRAKYPPGPWKLPFIGNLLQLVCSLPHRRLRDLSKKYGPIMYLKLGECSTIVISSPKVAEEVLRYHDLNFSDRPEIFVAKISFKNGLGIAFAPYGDYYSQMRKICTTELLSSQRVLSFRYIREEEVMKFIKSISSSSGNVINLSKKLLALTNRVSSRAIFGKSCDDREFLAAIAEVISLAGGFALPDMFPSLTFLHRFSTLKSRLEKLSTRIDIILNNIIDDHRAKMNKETVGTEESCEEDLIDLFLKLQQSSKFPITTYNIIKVLNDIFSGGTDTTSTTLEWAMSELVKNPPLMKKVQAEVRHVIKGKGNVEETDLQHMKYMKLVIKETLRLHPVAPLLLPREAKETCQINGYNVPKKTKVIINAWAIGRDEKYWKNADSFKPDRFEGSQIDFKGTNFEFIPFGAGRRMCPGLSYGNATIELTLAQLLYHFDWKLPNGMNPENLDMIEAFGATVKRKNDLKLIAVPYVPCVLVN